MLTKEKDCCPWWSCDTTPTGKYHKYFPFEDLKNIEIAIEKKTLSDLADS